MGEVLRKIEEIEKEMAKMEKNKATPTHPHHGTLKAKLAKLRRELNLPKSRVLGQSPGHTKERRIDHEHK